MAKELEYSKRIGENLRLIRVEKGLMQIDVAVATDLDRTYVSRIETGKARITCALLYRLVKGLEITSKDLIQDQITHFSRQNSYNQRRRYL